MLGLSIFACTLSACSIFGSQSYQAYCLEEKENNGYDYMIVTDYNVCDQSMDDVEWYDGPIGLNIGDVAYVERDSTHSSKNRKSTQTINPINSYPAFTSTPRAPQPLAPVQPKICPKANYKPAPPAPKPAPPAPKPPTPAPVVPKPQPAPVVPKPVATASAPTIKPGC